MAMFDALLAEVAEADRKVFRRYPGVAAKIDKTDEFVSRWEKWRDDNWDKEAGMTKNAVAAIAAKDNEIEALRLLQGNDMTWDEMKTNVDSLLNTRGVVTKEYVEKEIVPKLGFAKPADIEAVDKKIQNLALGMDAAYGASAHLPSKYYREFGNVEGAPEFTMAELFKHMNEKKIANFDDAYKSYTEPLRVKQNEAAAKVKEEEIRKQVREETLKEITLKQGALPVDQRGSSPEMSALTMRINARKKIENNDAPKLTPGELGSQAGAQDAYRQYIADQAAGVKPKLPSYLNIQ
jgi:hypothetical protein